MRDPAEGAGKIVFLEPRQGRRRQLARASNHMRAPPGTFVHTAPRHLHDLVMIAIRVWLVFGCASTT